MQVERETELISSDGYHLSFRRRHLHIPPTSDAPQAQMKLLKDAFMSRIFPIKLFNQRLEKTLENLNPPKVGCFCLCGSFQSRTEKSAERFHEQQKVEAQTEDCPESEPRKLETDLKFSITSCDSQWNLCESNQRPS